MGARSAPSSRHLDRQRRRVMKAHVVEEVNAKPRSCGPRHRTKTWSGPAALTWPRTSSTRPAWARIHARWPPSGVGDCRFSLHSRTVLWDAERLHPALAWPARRLSPAAASPSPPRRGPVGGRVRPVHRVQHARVESSDEQLEMPGGPALLEQPRWIQRWRDGRTGAAHRGGRRRAAGAPPTPTRWAIRRMDGSFLSSVTASTRSPCSCSELRPRSAGSVKRRSSACRPGAWRTARRPRRAASAPARHRRSCRTSPTEEHHVGVVRLVDPPGHLLVEVRKCHSPSPGSTTPSSATNKLAVIVAIGTSCPVGVAGHLTVRRRRTHSGALRSARVRGLRRRNRRRANPLRCCAAQPSCRRRCRRTGTPDVVQLVVADALQRRTRAAGRSPCLGGTAGSCTPRARGRRW